MFSECVPKMNESCMRKRNKNYFCMNLFVSLISHLSFEADSATARTYDLLTTQSSFFFFFSIFFLFFYFLFFFFFVKYLSFFFMSCLSLDVNV